MRPMAIFLLVAAVSASVPDEAGFRSGHAGRPCALAPWTDGREMSVGRDEARVTRFIGSGQRPDILDVARVGLRQPLVYPELRDLVGRVFGDRFVMPREKQVNILRHRFEFLLPAIYSVLGYLFEQYPDRTIVFMGRDCDFVYDTARILVQGSPMQDRIRLLPASKRLIYSLRDKVLSGGEADRALISRYLAIAGITEESLGRREKFIFVDTGFDGSAGMNLMKIANRLFERVLSGKDSGTFDSKLIMAYADASMRGLQLEFPGVRDMYVRNFPELRAMDNTRDDFLSMGWNREANYLLGQGLQLFPKYTGSFLDVELDVHGRVAFVTHQGPQDVFIESLVNVSPENYNPPAALLAQLMLADTVRGHILSGRSNVRAVLSALHDSGEQQIRQSS